MNRNSNILIIDGTSVFVRNWIQNPSMNEDGESIGGVIGFLHTLYEMIDILEPTRIIVAFDGKSPLDWRRSIYTKYKSDRFSHLKFNRQYDMLTYQDELKFLKKQFVTLYSVLTQLPLKVISVESFESFDTIYHLVKNNSTAESKYTIVSNNVDFLQLISPNIKLYSPYKKNKSDFDTGDELSPLMLFYYHAIHGKKNYNIPGVKNIGMKKFTKLFDCSMQTPNIDDILNVCKNSLKTSTVYKNVLDNEDLIRKNILIMSANPNYNSDVINILAETYNSPDVKYNKLKLIETLNEQKIIHCIRDFNLILDNTFSKIILN
jgi:5'-3' exonuclease